MTNPYGTWPESSELRHDGGKRLMAGNRFYEVEHDLQRGGRIIRVATSPATSSGFAGPLAGAEWTAWKPPSQPRSRSFCPLTRPFIPPGSPRYKRTRHDMEGSRI